MHEHHNIIKSIGFTIFPKLQNTHFYNCQRITTTPQLPLIQINNKTSIPRLSSVNLNLRHHHQAKESHQRALYLLHKPELALNSTSQTHSYKSLLSNQICHNSQNQQLLLCPNTGATTLLQRRVGERKRKTLTSGFVLFSFQTF